MINRRISYAALASSKLVVSLKEPDWKKAFEVYLNPSMVLQFLTEEEINDNKTKGAIKKEISPLVTLSNEQLSSPQKTNLKQFSGHSQFFSFIRGLYFEYGIALSRPDPYKAYESFCKGFHTNHDSFCSYKIAQTLFDKANKISAQVEVEKGLFFLTMSAVLVEMQYSGVLGDIRTETLRILDLFEEGTNLSKILFNQFGKNILSPEVSELYLSIFEFQYCSQAFTQEKYVCTLNLLEQHISISSDHNSIFYLFKLLCLQSTVVDKNLKKILEIVGTSKLECMYTCFFTLFHEIQLLKLGKIDNQFFFNVRTMFYELYSYFKYFYQRSWDSSSKKQFQDSQGQQIRLSSQSSTQKLEYGKINIWKLIVQINNSLYEKKTMFIQQSLHYSMTMRILSEVFEKGTGVEQNYQHALAAIQEELSMKKENNHLFAFANYTAAKLKQKLPSQFSKEQVEEQFLKSYSQFEERLSISKRANSPPGSNVQSLIYLYYLARIASIWSNNSKESSVRFADAISLYILERQKYRNVKTLQYEIICIKIERKIKEIGKASLFFGPSQLQNLPCLSSSNKQSESLLKSEKLLPLTKVQNQNSIDGQNLQNSQLPIPFPSNSSNFINNTSINKQVTVAGNIEENKHSFVNRSITGGVNLTPLTKNSSLITQSNQIDRLNDQKLQQKPNHEINSTNLISDMDIDRNQEISEQSLQRNDKIDINRQINGESLNSSQLKKQFCEINLKNDLHTNYVDLNDHFLDQKKEVFDKLTNQPIFGNISNSQVRNTSQLDTSKIFSLASMSQSSSQIEKQMLEKLNNLKLTRQYIEPSNIIILDFLKRGPTYTTSEGVITRQSLFQSSSISNQGIQSNFDTSKSSKLRSYKNHMLINESDKAIIDGEPIVIKQFNFNEIRSLNELFNYLDIQEARISRQPKISLQNLEFVKGFSYQAISSNQIAVYLLYPSYCFNLYGAIKGQQSFSLSEKILIATQICDSITSLHSCQINQINLKPSNILFDQNKFPYISGWEIKKSTTSITSEEDLNEEEADEKQQYTVGYTAPEIFNSGQNYNIMNNNQTPRALQNAPDIQIDRTLSDVWSIGMIFQYLFFSIDSGQEHYCRDKRVYSGFNLIITEYQKGSNFFLDQIKEVIESMCSFKPQERPSINSISKVFQRLYLELNTNIKNIPPALTPQPSQVRPQLSQIKIQDPKQKNLDSINSTKRGMSDNYNSQINFCSPSQLLDQNNTQRALTSFYDPYINPALSNRLNMNPQSQIFPRSPSTNSMNQTTNINK